MPERSSVAFQIRSLESWSSSRVPCAAVHASIRLISSSAFATARSIASSLLSSREALAVAMRASTSSFVEGNGGLSFCSSSALICARSASLTSRTRVWIGTTLIGR